MPIKTWSPWKPVARKNVEPDAPSARLSQVVWYSTACQTVKTRANATLACIAETAGT